MGAQKKNTSESDKGKAKGKGKAPAKKTPGPLNAEDLELLRHVIASTANSPSSRVVSVDYDELVKSYPDMNVRALHTRVKRLGDKTKGMRVLFRGNGRGKGKKGNKAQKEVEEEEDEDEDEDDDEDMGSADPGCNPKQPKDDEDDEGPMGKKGGGGGGASGLPVVAATA